MTRQCTVRPLSLRELIHLIDTATTDSMELRHERFPEGIVWWQVHEAGADPVRAAAEVEESDP